MITPATLPRSSTTVKFHLAGGAQPLILLPVRVNGYGPFNFIFDTGAGTSLLSPELGKQFEVEVLGAKEGQTAGGKVSVQLAKVGQLAVGDIAVADVEVGVVDLTQLGNAIGTRVDGDLGYNFFKNFRVTVDYRENEIRLVDPKRVENLERAAKTEVPIRLAHPAKPLILVDVYANGRGPFQFAIDTGTSTTAITPELAKQLELKTAAAGPITTGGAPIEVSTANLRTFQVGGAATEDLPVMVGGFFEMLSAAVGAKLDGIVGYNFLRNYKVVIDYPNERLSLL